MLPPEVGRAILAYSGAFFNLKDIVSNVLSFDTTNCNLTLTLTLMSKKKKIRTQ